MNKLALSLAAACIALAATTAYLVNEVHAERQRLGGAAPHSPGPPASRPAADQPASTRPPENSPDAAPRDSKSGDQAEAAPNGGRAPDEVRRRLQDELIVRLYNDEQGHRELIEERIPILRDRYLLLQRRLGIDDMQWLRFMEVVAEREVGRTAARAECKATRTCDLRDLTPELVAENQRRIAEVIGEKAAASVKSFDESQAERQGFSQLQQDMPENQRLSEERSEELVMALAKVREDTVRRMSASQARVGVHFGPAGVLIYDQNLPTPEARLESASNYSKQLREQARKYLSGKLFAGFNRQQDEMLERMRKAGK